MVPGESRVSVLAHYILHNPPSPSPSPLHTTDQQPATAGYTLPGELRRNLSGKGNICSLRKFPDIYRGGEPGQPPAWHVCLCASQPSLLSVIRTEQVTVVSCDTVHSTLVHWAKFNIGALICEPAG